MNIKAIETRYAGHRFRSRLEARWAVFFDQLGIAWEYEPQGYLTSAGPYLPDFRLTMSPRWSDTPKPRSDDLVADDCICGDLDRISGHCAYHSPQPRPRQVFLEVKPEFERSKRPDARWLDIANEHEIYIAYGIPRIEAPECKDGFCGSGDDWIGKSLQRICGDGEVCDRIFFRDCPYCGGIDVEAHGRFLEPLPQWPKNTPDDRPDWLLSAKHLTVCCSVVWSYSDSPWAGRPYRAASPRIVAAYAAARSARFDHGEVGAP